MIMYKSSHQVDSSGFVLTETFDEKTKHGSVSSVYIRDLVRSYFSMRIFMSIHPQSKLSSFVFSCSHVPFLSTYRITVIASCAMDLAYFPMDKQRCHLVIESCKYGILNDFVSNVCPRGYGTLFSSLL